MAPIALLVNIAVLAVIATIGIITPIIIKKKDTLIEQAAEKYIKEKTGIDVDFSPEEKK